jgi:hypothetical protein
MLIFWKNRTFQARPPKGERQEQRRGGNAALKILIMPLGKKWKPTKWLCHLS